MDVFFYMFIILMLIWIISCVSELPRKILNSLKTLTKKTIYYKYTVGGRIETQKHKEMIRYNRNLLLENQIPVNKVKFIFKPYFEYDIDNKIINPLYHVMIPDNNKKSIIAIKKPLNIIAICVDTYKFDDNYQHLKEVLKTSKHGIVVMLEEEITEDLLTKKPIQYKFGVDTEVIRYANLDVYVEQYKSTLQEVQTV